MDGFPIKVSFSKSIGEINDRVEIYVSNSQLLSSISKIACDRVGITHCDEYEFLNDSRIPLSMLNTIEFNNVIRDNHILLTNPEKEIFSFDESKTKIYQGYIWKPLAIVSLLLSVFGLIILITIYVINLSSIYSFSVVIDAGSTSSKIYLYHWVSNKFIYNADVVELGTCKTDHPISSYNKNPNSSFIEISKCLKDTIIPNIPKDNRYNSYVYLGATAGMRMLSHNDPNGTAQILRFLRESLQKYSLKINNSISDVSIISGAQEGVYGWITVNYLSKLLPKTITQSTNVVGALDMGGASTEITFSIQPSSDASGTHRLKLYGNSYSVYSHSYLCYGKSQAEYRFLADLIAKNNFSTTVNNPCMSKMEKADAFKSIDIFNIPCVVGKFAIEHYGYQIIPPDGWLTNDTIITFVGTSDHDHCNMLVKRLFNITKCDKISCTFNGVYQPNVMGKFKAFSAYNYIRIILNKENKDMELSEYKSKLKTLCNSNYSRQLYINTITNQWEKWECFDLMYMIEMLGWLGFNESNWRNIEFIDKIGESKVGWALGFMIDKTSIIPKEQHFLPIADFLFAILLVVLLIAMLFSIVFTYFFCKSVKRNRKSFSETNFVEEENLLASNQNSE